MEKDSGGRRGFFRKMAGAAAGLAGLSAFGSSCSGRTPGRAEAVPAKASGPSRVVIARDESIWSGDALDPEKVRALVFRAVRKLADADDDAAAWSAFFGPGERVSIKLNCIAGRMLSTTPEVTHAIASGLRAAGVGKGDIVGWDRTNRELRRAGYTLGENRSGAVFVGTDDRQAGYENELAIAGEVGSLVSKIANRWSDAMVNAPVLKDHDLAGMSGALKNYFGAIHNPNKLHENGCDPYVADLNTMPVFKDKTRLIVCDGTTAQYHAGPSYKEHYAWRFSGVIVAADPVAADSVARSIINEKRKSEGLPTIEEEGRPAKYIESAAAPARALGENRLDRIEIFEV